MSHLASHLGQADDAIALARQGQAVLRTGPARVVLGCHAAGFEREHAGPQARVGRAECSSLLLRAEKALEGAPAEPASPWVSHFDAGSLASEAARCMRQVGDLAQARQQAERIIVLRPGTRTRSRAFGQLALVSILIDQGQPDHACAIATDVLSATVSLGSYLVITQLLQLQQQLQPYGDTSAVADFLDCLQDTVRNRLPFYQLIATDQHAPHDG
jgi:hypothetical protein